MRPRNNAIDAFGTSRWSNPPARRRVLFISCHLPYPPVSGGRRRELELLRRVSEKFDIHQMVVSKTIGQDVEHVDRLAEICRDVELFAAAPDDGRAAGDAPQVLRHRCPQLSRRVAELTARGAIDLIHVEGFYLMQHVRPWTSQPVLLVEQNVEYDLERQRARACAATTDLAAFSNAIRTRTAEIASWKRATRLAAVTEEDRDTILQTLPSARVTVVPNGADHVPTAAELAPEPAARPSAPLLVFAANFAYAPNVDAALHLHRQILPLVRSRIPETQLWLVGNDPPREVRALEEERVRVTGRVPDILPFVDAADAIVCPLRIGGGIKVKSTEALRRAKAVVSTTVGLQGLPDDARSATLVADEPEQFAHAIHRVLTDRRLRTQMERSAGRAARRLPTWDGAAQALATVYDDLLSAGSAGRRAQRAARGGSR